jgi:hypothetical protein
MGVTDRIPVFCYRSDQGDRSDRLVNPSNDLEPLYGLFFAPEEQNLGSTKNHEIAIAP